MLYFQFMQVLLSIKRYSMNRYSMNLSIVHLVNRNSDMLLLAFLPQNKLFHLHIAARQCAWRERSVAGENGWYEDVPSN